MNRLAGETKAGSASKSGRPEGSRLECVSSGTHARMENLRVVASRRACSSSLLSHHDGAVREIRMGDKASGVCACEWV